MIDSGWSVAAFAVPEHAVCGVLLGGPSPRLLFIGPADAAAGVATASFKPASIARQDPAGAWIVASEGAALEFAGPDPEADALTPCEVSGEFGLDGTHEPVAARGVRCGRLPSRKVGSVRFVATWFTAGHGIALLAARPERAAGQDRDDVAVLASGEAAGMSVFDARLSTTYGPDRMPLRMGIELWLGESDDGDQYPRRVAGTTAGPAASDVLGGVRVLTLPLRCQSRGDEGLGVYVLLSAA